MKSNASRNERDMRELTDLMVAVALGWLASAAFGLSLPLAIFVAVMACPVSQPETRGRLWRHPAIRLTFLALLLLWLVGNWSAYRHGVSAGYEAVAGATPR